MNQTWLNGRKHKFWREWWSQAGLEGERGERLQTCAVKVPRESLSPWVGLTCPGGEDGWVASTDDISLARLKRGISLRKGSRPQFHMWQARNGGKSGWSLPAVWSTFTVGCTKLMSHACSKKNRTKGWNTVLLNLLPDTTCNLSLG